MANSIAITKGKGARLKKGTEIDEELLAELVQGLKDIKEGRVKRVK